MDRFYVGIDPQGYSYKPTNIAKVKKASVDNYGDYELNAIAKHVGNEGHAILPSRLEGGMKQENFRSIQIFMLDFDGAKYNQTRKCTEGKNVSFEEIKFRAEQAGLSIAFAYRTLSCSDIKPYYKFRIAFVHEYPLSDRNLALLAYRELLRIFPECDSACGELSRLFLGGKGLLYCNPNARFNLVQLTLNIYSYLDHERHFCRNLESMMKGVDIDIVNKRIALGTVEMMSIFGANTDSPNITLIEESHFAPIFYIHKTNHFDGDKNSHHNMTCRRSIKHRVDIQKQIDLCFLLRDFFSGLPLNHMQRFMIATNLVHMNRGIDSFMQTIRTCYNPESVEKWEHDITRTIRDYLPMDCSADLCPYYAKCKQSSSEKNIIGKLLNDRRIHCIQSKKYATINEAMADLDANLSRALKSPKQGFHMIRAQTAIGKTRAIIQMVKKYPQKTFLIAEPLCSMVIQIFEDLIRECGHDSIGRTYSVRGTPFLSQEDKNTYFNLHNSGNHKAAKRFIADRLAWLQENEPFKIAAIEELKMILEGVNLLLDKRVVITTHAMLLNLPIETILHFDEVLIDEDILYLQILSNAKNISTECLQMVAHRGVYGYSKIADEMLAGGDGKYHCFSNTPVFLPEWSDIISDQRIDSYEERSLYSQNNAPSKTDNISDLSKAVSYIKFANTEGYQYFCRQDLPSRKYILLSATTNASVYKDYFGESMAIHEYPCVSASYKGKLKQFTYHSLGRGDLKNKQQIYDFVSDYTQYRHIEMISFMSEEKNHPNMNSAGLHFGNAVGVNDLAGKDIVIIGTPYKHPSAYMLPCCYLYGEDVVNADRMIRQRVDFNGYNFLIMSYHNQKLKQFEMYSLESELEQCIGRARLLRCDCTVYLFSAFPCEQAQIMPGDYLKKYQTDEGDQTLLPDPLQSKENE